jgi:methyltransferase family protein
MASPPTEAQRGERFAAYIEARRFDPPRPLLVKAAALVARKEHALDAGAGALNATKYLLSAGFTHVTALDAAPSAQKLAAELAPDRVDFVLSRFEDFAYPTNAYDLVNAEFSLPFIRAENFAPVFVRLLGAVPPGGLFTGQLFGPKDSWNVADSGMNFHSRTAVEDLLRGFELVELEEEDHPGKTKLGDDKHWHIFHLIARKPAA